MRDENTTECCNDPLQEKGIQMKGIYIKDLEVNEEITGFFLVKYIKIKTSIWSFSSREVPTSWPWTAKKV